MDAPSAIDVDSDPRVTGEYVRQVADDHGTVTLVGVVHDHPASTYRVRHVIDDVDPEVLALEVPPISLGLFEQCAATTHTPPPRGGEMSAAIQAADWETIAGIDAPTVTFFGRLGMTLLRTRPPLGTVRTILSDAAETTKEAFRCLGAAALEAYTSLRLDVGSQIPHDIARTAAPAEQAHHEREHVCRCRSFLNAFRTANRCGASRLEDDVREAAMAARLAKLRTGREGHIVAVVGIDHLGSLAKRLAEPDA